MVVPRVKCRGTLVVVSIFGLVLVAGLALSLAMHMKTKEGSRSRPPRSSEAPPPPSDWNWNGATDAIARTCRVTSYPDVCVKELMSFPGAAAATVDPEQLVPMSMNATRRRLVDALSDVKTIAAAASHDGRAASAYQDCVDLLDAAADLLHRSEDAFMTSSSNRDDDVATWLSAALTYHDTCNDSLHEVSDSEDVHGMKPRMVAFLAKSNLAEHLSNSLAIFANNNYNNRSSSSSTLKDSDCSDEHNDDMVVAQDGTGTHRTISDAVNAAPAHSPRRVVIRVKAGTYTESVVVPRNKTNLTLAGAGVNRTILVGSRNVVDHRITTFRTATVSVLGDRFIMRDLTVENRAGPEKAQAVALLVSADEAVIFRCAILGYQDTLYAHAHRQFYRDCDVAGTVDFVAGNAAAVLQNCTLWARRPKRGQRNTVTAQGRRHAHQNTGVSVHRCRLLPSSPELLLDQDHHPKITYLGRPWRPYARVVYMMSSMADHIHAAGWLPWGDDGGVMPPDTVYYGEYQNTGPGASVAQRVAWPGHHVITTPEEAINFTVGSFIAGSAWLPPTKLPFDAGLLFTQ
ncbi:hypothetical protein PR202_gb27257 [Eleusine coracana subsp. coracana]|uniref:Pectinesterase inhibitor domain-containing protein n=1 Tax=Eleusine coracana subsp. coracana TaxID=191504 RepID=A0AAV5FR58_ELECO|nr:hypothetical protein PR202_gb27257 [Eleusine coracana subsp. coracana]